MNDRAVLCVESDDAVRVRAAANVLGRVWRYAPVNSAKPANHNLFTEHLSELHKNGLIFAQPQQTGETLLTYGPSIKAKTAIATSPAARWGARVEKYLGQDVQSIKGALFTFPVEGGAESLTAFITDWSPFPAACALAVQHGHPLADPSKSGTDHFTGSFVRHPLTGDLLPVWTAGWIKPGLGTGTVVVNPAHSSMDLEFARHAGLPVRFALAPTPPTENPETWINPPFVGSGVATRTGIADGSSSDDTRSIYLTRLQAAGWATPFTDCVLGSLALGNASKDLPMRGLLPDSSNVAAPDVVTVLSGALDQGATFVTTRATLERVMLLRALHIDLYGHDVANPQVVVVSELAGQPSAKFPVSVVELAAIAFGRNDETTSVKPQQLEQADRFMKNHGPIREAFVSDSPTIGSRSEKILTSIRHSRFSDAFTELYKLQRDLKKNPSLLDKGDHYGYFAAAFTLAGLEPPPDYDLDLILSDAAAGTE